MRKRSRGGVETLEEDVQCLQPEMVIEMVGRRKVKKKRRSGDQGRPSLRWLGVV